MSIKTLIRARTQHWTRVASTRRMDNLSDFECSCGLFFVASDISNVPKDAASMMSVHIAKETLEALDLPTGVVIDDLQAVPGPPAGAIIVDAHDSLMQWDPGFSGVGFYRTPDGDHLETSEVAGPVTVLWIPAES